MLKEISAKVIEIDGEKVGVILQGEPLDIYILQRATYGVIDTLFAKEKDL